MCLRPSPNTRFIDDCLSTASLLLLQHIHSLQRRYDVFGYDIRLLTQILDGEGFFRGAGEEGAGERLRPVVDVCYATEI
jgi:hypothetical protein